MAQLLTSRRLWTFIVAQIVSIATFLVAHYVNDPNIAGLAAIVIATVEGGAAIAIGQLTKDDIAGIQANKEIQLAAIAQGTHPEYPVQGMKSATVNAPVAPVTLPTMLPAGALYLAPGTYLYTGVSGTYQE